MSRAFLLAEFAILYIALPLAYRFSPVRVPARPLRWAVDSYAQTGSLFASSFEHALYGCWLFTVGLGPYFYHGTIATVGFALRR